MSSGSRSPAADDGSSRRHEDRRDVRAERLLVALGVVLLPLAVGGAHAPVNAALAAALLSVTAVVVWRRRELRAGPEALAVALALAATCLQCLPLPLSAWRWLSPATHEVLHDAYGEPGWAALSLDPPATHHELVKLVALLCGAVLGAELWGRERRHVGLLQAIALSGVGVMGLGLIHTLARVTRTYDSFGPNRVVFVSSFVNPNHLGGFLGFCAFAALGAAFMGTDRRRLLWGAAAVLCGLGVFLSLSRGAMLAFVATAGVMGVALGLRPGALGRRAVLAVQGLLLGTITLAVGLGLSRIVYQLSTLGEEHGLSKAVLWRPLPDLLAQFPLGVGRGATYAAFARLSLWSGEIYAVPRVENEPLQALLDWGVPLGAAVLAACAWAWWSAWRANRADLGRRLALAGVAYLALHNLVDFNLTLTSVALPVVLMLAAFNSAAEAKPRWVVRRAPAGVALAVLAMVTALAAWSALAFELDRDTLHLRDRLAAAERPARLAAAEAAVRRHPGALLLPLLVAERELATTDGAAGALAWVNRGMRIAPYYGPAHQLAGRALWRLGARGQSLLEYRLACAADAKLIGGVLRELATLGGADGIADLARSGPAVLRVEAARHLVQLRRHRTALELLGRPEPPAELVGEAAAQVAASAYFALRDHDGAAAEGRALQRTSPASYHGYVFEAQALRARRETAAAVAVLQRGLAATGGPGTILSLLAELLTEQGRYPEARDIGQRLLSRSLSPSETAGAHGVLADVYSRQGEHARASRELEKARDRMPEVAVYRVQLAEARERMGDVAGAIAELERARAELGSAASIDRELARLRGKQSAGR